MGQLQHTTDYTAINDELVRRLEAEGLLGSSVDDAERAHDRSLYFLEDGTVLVVWDRGFIEHLRIDQDTLEEKVLGTWDAGDFDEN